METRIDRTQRHAKQSAIIFAATAIAVALIGVAPTSPAHAACNPGLTYTGGTPSSMTVWTNECAGGQARVYRYVSTYPTAYDGPQRGPDSYSTAQSSAGVAAGGAYRLKPTSSGSWSSWTSYS